MNVLLRDLFELCDGFQPFIERGNLTFRAEAESDCARSLPLSLMPFVLCRLLYFACPILLTILIHSVCSTH